MTRSEYTRRVLSCLKGTTKEETEAIRAEIDGHMEDCYLAMLDLGYPEEIAEERTLSRMGDPEEVGRELDKQYPLRWLVIGDLAVGLSVLMGLLLILFLAAGEPNMVRALWERWNPEPIHVLTTVETEADTDLRCPVGNDILRVYRVCVGELEGQRLAILNVDTFDRIPLGAAAYLGEDHITLENQRGETGRVYQAEYESLRSRYLGHWIDRACPGVPVEPEDTYVTLRLERFGQTAELRIPLPKEGTP